MPGVTHNFSPEGARIVIGAVTLVTALYPVIALILIFTGVIPANGIGTMPPETVQIVTIVFSAIGVMSTALSFVMKRILRRRTAAANTPSFRQRFTAVLVAIALAEMAGALGLVYALLTGKIGLPCLLWGLSIGACILHFPSRLWLQGDSE